MACKECVHWDYKYDKQSGIPLPDSDIEWVYRMGYCDVEDRYPPEWGGCHRFKKKRGMVQ